MVYTYIPLHNTLHVPLIEKKKKNTVQYIGGFRVYLNQFKVERKSIWRITRS